MDERGPWSANPFPNNIGTHWKLDKTEDSGRRRLKLKRNYKFDERLCHPPCDKSPSGTSHLESECHTGAGGSVPEKMKRFLLKGVRGITEEQSFEIGDDVSESTSLIESDHGDSTESQSASYLKDSSDHLEIVHDMKDLPSSSIEGESSEVCNS